MLIKDNMSYGELQDLFSFFSMKDDYQAAISEHEHQQYEKDIKK